MRPGVYDLTASQPGLARTRVQGIKILADMESELIDPLVLHEPARLTLMVDPPRSPTGTNSGVRLFRVDKSVRREVETVIGTTDSDGIWRSQDLSPGPYQLALEDQNESRWHLEEFEVDTGRNEKFVQVDLVEIEGQLTRGGESLSAVLWFGGIRSIGRIRVDADRDGQFAGYLTREGDWQIDLELPDETAYTRLKSVHVSIPKGKSRAELEIQIPDTRIYGRVMDEKRELVEGAEIKAIHQSEGSTVLSASTSDENGDFEVTGLQEGRVRLQASQFGQQSDWIEVNVSERRSAPLVELILKEKIEIEGQVMSSAGPVSGASVVAWPTLSAENWVSIGGQTVSDPSGGFAMELPRGTREAVFVTMAHGHSLKIITATIAPSGDPIEIFLDEPGSKLSLNFSEADESAKQSIVVYEGTVVPARLLAAWARQQRAHQPEPGVLDLPNVEPGNYSLCSSPDSNPTAQSGVGPACSSGTLASFGHLTLDFPQ